MFHTKEKQLYEKTKFGERIIKSYHIMMNFLYLCRDLAYYSNTRCDNKDKTDDIGENEIIVLLDYSKFNATF